MSSGVFIIDYYVKFSIVFGRFNVALNDVFVLRKEVVGGAGDVGGDERSGGPGDGDVESDAASESGGREFPADD